MTYHLNFDHFFLSPSSPLPITRYHLPSSDASIHHPRNFHSKLKCHLFENSYPHVIIHPPNLNDIHLNSYSVFSDFLEIGPVLTMDYPLNNPFIRCSARECAGALMSLTFEWRSRN